MAVYPNNSVLIVDDEVAIRSMLQRIFQSSGFEVGTAENGVEGLKASYESSWDAVIVDRGMPEMNGEEMAKQIKVTHPNIPIILITGLPHLVTRLDLYVTVVAKPFQPFRLVDLVAEANAGRQRSAELG